MELLRRKNLEQLITTSQHPCVSIYMPTHRAGRETQQDPIRLKNLLRQAEDQLVELGLEKSEVSEILSSARERLSDREFWQNQGDGLAIFLSDAESHIYRLPLDFEELLYVTDHFYIKPLLPMLSKGAFYLLTLSLNNIRLFRLTEYTLNEIALENMPTDMATALQYDDPRSQLQPHTSAASVSGKESVFHGHDSADDRRRKQDILRFFHKVDDGIHQLIAGQNVPLVVAGTDYLLPLYREANTYPHLLEETLDIGSPEHLNKEEIHQRAWTIVEPHMRKPEHDILDRFQELKHTATTSNALTEILPAAYQGRVDTLLVAQETQRWGTYDPESRAVTLSTEIQPGDQDLLELAVSQTLLNSGEVFELKREDIPESEAVAALFRY